MPLTEDTQNINVNCLKVFCEMDERGRLWSFNLSDISGMVAILLCRAQLNYCIFIQLFYDSFICIKIQSALNL